LLVVCFYADFQNSHGGNPEPLMSTSGQGQTFGYVRDESGKRY
jgi:hypothetical protein